MSPPFILLTIIFWTSYFLFFPLKIVLTLHTTFHRSSVGSPTLFLLGAFCFSLEKEKTCKHQPFPSAFPYSAQRNGYISRGEPTRGRDVDGAKAKILWFLCKAPYSKEPCQQHNIQTPLDTLPVRFICLGNQECMSEQ